MKCVQVIVRSGIHSTSQYVPVLLFASCATATDLESHRSGWRFKKWAGEREMSEGVEAKMEPPRGSEWNDGCILWPATM